ncbi:MAG: DNA polymerase I [Bacteroidaceae bacterium]|nr:DNA polymerase I [Bacteroidaceae bacterium]MBR5275565.1 DNA polymerase I [Bacteroidaceae bacterium]
MEKLFLLDAYALIYRAYYAFIKNPRINSKGFNTSAILGFINTLEDVLKKENPTHIGIAFDPKGPTFRHEAYKEYKAQREETPEVIRESVPVIKEFIKAYNIPIFEVSGFEADDVIGTLAKQAEKRGIITYMMTPDKDYGQLVSETTFIYRPKYGDKEFEVLGVERVKEKFGINSTGQVIDLLGLMGDSSDNIPGCPGVGEKTAQKLIAQFGSIENMLDNTGELKGALKNKVEENKEKILFSKFLATIKTDVPIELDMESLKRETPDEEKLTTLLDFYELRALKERVKKTNFAPSLFDEAQQSVTPATAVNNKKETKQESLQGSLFDFFQAEDTGGEKKSSHLTLKEVSHTYKLIENEEDISNLTIAVKNCKTICFDTETTSTNALDAELVGISLSTKEGEAFYVTMPADRESVIRRLEIMRPIFENEESEKVGQNMKYDITVLANYGIDVKGRLFDTMIAHYVLQPELYHGMDYLAEIYLGYDTIKIEELIGEKGRSQKNMRDVPPAIVCDYACEDADVTLKLKNILQEELKKEGIEELFYNIEMPLVPVLAYMERNGARIDTGSLKETSTLFSKRLADIEEEIYSLAGEPFNIASPKQVGDILFGKLKIVEKPKKTKTGQFVTSEEVLAQLQNRHPIVKNILQYRGLKKLLSTYVDALPALVSPRSGKIHTSYNQTVTATGRLSSSNPNLQNIPIRDEDGKEVRKAFVPDEGCLFLSVDYSQIELRIMAHLSGDSNMIEDFRSGHDIHAATAAKVYRKPIGEVTKDERRKAKVANFGIIYGISVFGLAERMNVDRREAKELIENYFATYGGVQQYIEKCKHEAKEKGYVETIFHRKRYLPDINSHNAVVRGYAERNAVNAPIQGSAADIIKVAMINIYRRMKAANMRSTMILQVHDELNFNIVPKEKDAMLALVLEEMQNAISMSVPLVADHGWGRNWLEAH